MPGPPYIVVIGGPNGAGKSTIARSVVEKTFDIDEFVNADTIAAGLSAFNPGSSAFAAGRIMLDRLHQLALARVTFAFESTLASRSLAPWLASQIALGYRVHIVYVSLRSSRLALARVRHRVRKGGHNVPGPIVKRRFHRSAANLFNLYLPLAVTWRIYDNSQLDPILIAECDEHPGTRIHHPKRWNLLHDQASKASQDQ